MRGDCRSLLCLQRNFAKMLKPRVQAVVTASCYYCITSHVFVADERGQYKALCFKTVLFSIHLWEQYLGHVFDNPFLVSTGLKVNRSTSIQMYKKTSIMDATIKASWKHWPEGNTRSRYAYFTTNWSSNFCLRLFDGADILLISL